MNFLSKAKEIAENTKKKKQSLQFFKRKKQWLQYQEKVFFETDIKRRETLTRKIEMINIIIAEVQPKRHNNCIHNLKHRSKF